MKIYVCRICGEVLLANEESSYCPFCGAPKNYFILADEYKEPEIKELSGVSKKNLEKALELEVDNARFYRCASNKATTIEGRLMFKGLSKIEAEHASTIAKALKIKNPMIDLFSKDCSEEYKENLDDALGREHRATEFYTGATAEAKEERVREIFGALILVEREHIKLLEGKTDGGR